MPMRPNRTTALMAVAFAVGFCASAQAEIYRWVDENGQVHYSGQRPLDQAAEEVDVNTSGSGSQASADAAAAAFAASREDAEKRKSEAAEQAAEQAAKAEKCARAREVVGYFENRIPNRVFVDGPDGERARMTEEQHARELATARKNAATLCSGA